MYREHFASTRVNEALVSYRFARTSWLTEEPRFSLSVQIQVEVFITVGSFIKSFCLVISCTLSGMRAHTATFTCWGPFYAVARFHEATLWTMHAVALAGKVCIGYSVWFSEVQLSPVSVTTGNVTNSFLLPYSCL